MADDEYCIDGSAKVLQDVREFAIRTRCGGRKSLLAIGMAEKAKELVATGSGTSYGNLPNGAKEHH